MGRGESVVSFLVDEFALPLRIFPPEEEHDPRAAIGDLADDAVCELLPALVSMRSGLAGGDGQHRVQEQHALLGPAGEIAAHRRCQPKVGLKLTEDVLKRRRRLDARRNREAEPHRLTGTVVGILAEDDDANVIEGGAIQRLEHVVGPGVEAARGANLGDEKGAEFLHPDRSELVPEHGEPALMHPWRHAGEPIARRQSRDVIYPRVVAPPLVELRGVTKRYHGPPVLSDLTFEIEEGEVLGYIGPNGAGKTTTLKILAGLIRTYEGQAVVAGIDIARDRRATHSLIGFLPQAVGFQSWRTVESALDSLGALSGVPRDVRARRIPALLERFDLTLARSKKVKELSGGMARKLGLIQALLHEPRLLILDEPLEGLDPPTRSLLKDVIRERQHAGTTVLFSSHILSDVEDIADRIGILDGGRIATSGSIRELLTVFGLPIEIEVEYSVVPPDTAFLVAAAVGAEVRRPGVWRVKVEAGRDPDEIVNQLIEQSLAVGGRIRRIGEVEPDLDDLFARYIGRAS